ncbi:hypothetical protein V6N13_101352 [Hibiscus sabdariffa]|uniref:PUM-HD domain-containing protein n=1 Tax=Hibiscus sabdariffa TaxID=183260 RepID=A0ABR2QL31_9ROSI
MEGFGGDAAEDLQWRLMTNLSLQNQFQIKDYVHVFTNPSNQGLQGHGVFQSQNPNESLEESFARMNLNQTGNTRVFGPGLRGPTMELFRDGFYGGYPNSTRSLGSQNMVRSPNFPGNIVDNSFFDTNIQRSIMPFERPNHAWPGVNGLSFQNPLWTDMLPPSMYDQRPVFYPPRQRPRPRCLLPPLNELKGQVCTVAKDQNGCRLLQKKLEHEIISDEEIGMIFMEVKDQLHVLMVHRFANYFIQKLFKASNQEIKTQLLLLLVRSPQRFLEVCTDVHGSRTVQKFLDRSTYMEQRCFLLSFLKPIAFTLTNNSSGHHIILHCLYNLSNKEKRLLADEIVEHCISIATNKSGCCVLQQCLVCFDVEIRDHLLDQIIANALLLSEDEFGNYVVQYVLGLRIDDATEAIIDRLGGSFVTLSFNKYGSNVVEKCLKESGDELSSRIIMEIINDPDFVKVIGHDYGNYVAQSALSVSKGDIHDALLAFIWHNYTFLQSNPFGRMVLS